MSSYIVNNNGGSSGGYTRAQFVAALEQLQPKLYDTTSVIPSGKSANIKTINGNSVLGGGNLTIAAKTYTYDLTENEQGWYDDAMDELALLDPEKKFIKFGFITDLHTMPTRSQIQADNDIEDVVADMLSYGVVLEEPESGTIADGIRSTWPSSDDSYYGVTSEPAIKIMGAIGYNYGLDAVFCNGDLSSGRLPYNSYSYMLEIMARMFDKYVSVPHYVTKGNHDHKYNADVAVRSSAEWMKYVNRFNYSGGQEVVFVKDIPAAVAQNDTYPLTAYYVNIDKGGSNKLRMCVLNSYEGQWATSLNYSLSIVDKTANEWIIGSISHDMSPFSSAWLESYYNCCMSGTARGKGAGSEQHTFPRMNNGAKTGGAIGHIRGHIHQSQRGLLSTTYQSIMVANAYGSTPCFSIFIIDTDEWWMYELQVGRRPRNDSSYPDVEGVYEKVKDGVYRYKIYVNPRV